MAKKVLVTGSSQGIGASIILEFAGHGYDVIINFNHDDISASKLKNYIENKYNVKSYVVKCDVSNEDEVCKMKHYIEDNIGNIDVIVNNAGIAMDNYYMNKSSFEFKKVLDTNLLGTFLVTKYISTLIKKGVIINISSNNGIDDGYPESMDYDASKAGVISLTHNFAKALSPDIRVNCVAPGWIDTNMNKDISPLFKKEALDNILLHRFGTPKEVAKLVYFLASEDASYINDAIIKIDGGVK